MRKVEKEIVLKQCSGSHGTDKRYEVICVKNSTSWSVGDQFDEDRVKAKIAVGINVVIV